MGKKESGRNGEGGCGEGSGNGGREEFRVERKGVRGGMKRGGGGSEGGGSR